MTHSQRSRTLYGERAKEVVVETIVLAADGSAVAEPQTPIGVLAGDR